MQIKTSSCSILLSLFLLIMLSISISSPEPAAEASGYIVFTDSVPENIEPEAFYMKTLRAALGSGDVAKTALVYSYRNGMNGFSAYLNSSRLMELLKQPGVLEVIPSRQYHLDTESAESPSF